MRYAILIYGSREVWDGLDADMIRRLGSTHARLQEELQRTGELIDHQELRVDRAQVVLPRGEAHARAGVLEQPWIVGGYYFVDCDSDERAADIAASFVEAEFAPIEVRLLSSESSWDDATLVS